MVKCMAQVNVRNRKKADGSNNWEYRFEAAKIDGKRKHISKGGFKTKEDCINSAKLYFESHNCQVDVSPMWTRCGRGHHFCGHKTSKTLDFTWLEEPQFLYAPFVDATKFYIIYCNLSTSARVDI